MDFPLPGPFPNKISYTELVKETSWNVNRKTQDEIQGETPPTSEQKNQTIRLVSFAGLVVA